MHADGTQLGRLRSHAFRVHGRLLRGHRGYKGHASRQLKAVFNKEHLEKILAHLDSKPDMIDEYIATVDEFKEAMEEG